MVKEVLFWVAGTSIVAGSGIVIAAVWKLVDNDIAGRSAATVAVIGAAAVGLAMLQTYLK